MLSSILDMLTLKTVVVGLVMGVLGYWLIRKLKYKLPPGPFALPIIGNILDLRNPMFHLKFFEWSHKYGPVISVYFGPQRWTIINTIDVALEALVKKGNDFADRPQLASTDMFSEGGKDIAFGRFGPTWRLHRKIASNAFRHYMMGEQLEIRIHKAVNSVSELLNTKKDAVNPKEYIDLLVFNIICGFCLGKSFDIDDPEFKWIIKADDDLIAEFSTGVWEDIIPLLKYFPTKKFRNLKKTVDEILQKFGYEYYRQHQKSFDPSNIRDFIDCLIKARQEAEEEEQGEDVLDSLTETHLVQTLIDILFAGIDTSRFTIQWTLLFMASFPEIQTKVQDEVDRVVGRDRLPGLADRPRLGYTEAVLHESMRLGSVIPMGLMHSTTCDTTLGGYDVPKGSVVAINHWALHNDPDAWTEVDRFVPERFLNEDGKLGPKPTNWLPFSAGRRVCLGESVAKPELHLIFASLMQKFNIRLPLGVHADFEGTGSAFGSIPKPYKVFFEPRV